MDKTIQPTSDQADHWWVAVKCREWDELGLACSQPHPFL